VFVGGYSLGEHPLVMSILPWVVHRLHLVVGTTLHLASGPHVIDSGRSSSTFRTHAHFFSGNRERLATEDTGRRPGHGHKSLARPGKHWAARPCSFHLLLQRIPSLHLHTRADLAAAWSWRRRARRRERQGRGDDIVGGEREDEAKGVCL